MQWKTMRSTHQIYLPTEIIVHIVRFIAADGARRQSTLHACCLISRQWYLVAVSFLYEMPQLGMGTAFTLFTNTVAPPIRVRKRRVNLGNLVRRLDLSALVHHSSNSLTARLLNRVKENLEVFIAPRVSFSWNSLPSLSKCLNLRYLDLALVSDPVPFSSLEKALRHLEKLNTLRLPRHTFLTTPTANWPPRLQRLQVSGTFSPSTISSFPWPPLLTSLTLKNCDDLSVSSLGPFLSSPQLDRGLKRLTVSNLNRNLQPESINAIPAFLPNLTFLSVPGDLVEDTFLDIVAHMAPLSLQVLEFGYPYSNAELGFRTKSLHEALNGGLAELRSVGFAEVFVTEQRIVEDEEIELALQALAIKRARDRPVDGHVDTDVGVYYL